MRKKERERERERETIPHQLISPSIHPSIHTQNNKGLSNSHLTTYINPPTPLITIFLPFKFYLQLNSLFPDFPLPPPSLFLSLIRFFHHLNRRKGRKVKMSDEDWVKAAMADDSIVGEILVRLNHTLPLPPPPKKRDTPPLPLDWSVRQRRSRTMILPAKKQVSTRASPTTPLSWSGATSVSGGVAGGCTVDGFEESSRPPNKRCSGILRSKVIGTTETTSSKRPRKKKTLAELKVEEDLLLKERKYLKRKLESLRITLEKQRSENESLKRMKGDLPEGEIVTVVASDNDETIVEKTEQHDDRVAFPKPEAMEENNSKNDFALPDLNLPIEE